MLKFAAIRASMLAMGVLVFGASAQLPLKVKVMNVSGSAQAGAAITFGQVFKQGDIPSGQAIRVSSAGQDLASQSNIKARHPDGSVRHAVFSLQADQLGAGAEFPLQFAAVPPSTASDSVSLAELLATDFDAGITLSLLGAAYTASVRPLLAAGAVRTWISGPVCTEWIVHAPLKTAAGVTHPHLTSRFAIRAYKGLKRIRVDLAVENNWAYEALPQGFTYDAAFTIGKTAAFSQAGMAHPHHARWRKVGWWGGDPGLDFQGDRDYDLSTGAFPYYDKRVTIAATALSQMQQDFPPLSNGNLETYFPATGAAAGIGPMPQWSALYILSGDYRARRNVIANGNCGGTYAIHYRDKQTDLPVSLADYPYMTLFGNIADTRNPKTGLLEAFPVVTNPLEKFVPDDAHQPSIAFLPYVVSGDWFLLEELLFWANYNMVLAHPSYRQQEKGLLKWGQVRAQAWSMRTLGHAAFITPDDHPMKKYFVDRMDHNLAWYNQEYALNPNANALGLINQDSQRPWMDDFFTWTSGYLVQLGFQEAKTLAIFKSKYPIGRMSEPFCWLRAPFYEDKRIDSTTGKVYADFGKYYAVNFPAGGDCAGARMDGYPEAATGYGANLQPALAIAVDVGAPGAQAVWDRYETRNPKQNYSAAPQFAVVPKSVSLVVSSRKKNTPPESRMGLPGSWVVPGQLLEFELARPSQVFIEIFDSTGRSLRSVSLGKLPKGANRARMPGKGGELKGGLPYLVRLKIVDDFMAKSYLTQLRIVGP